MIVKPDFKAGREWWITKEHFVIILISKFLVIILHTQSFHIPLISNSLFTTATV